MADFTATAQMIPEGVNGGNRFVVRSIVPSILANADTFTVTLPAGVPKDALPVAAPLSYALSSDTYTRDADLVVVTTHNRATGVTVYTAGGAVAAGVILIQEYIGYG